MAGVAVSRLTLDSNVLLDYWNDRPRKAVVEELLRLSQDGKVDLIITRVIRDDIPREPWASYIAQLPALGVRETGTVARWGISTWDGGDMWGSDGSSALDAAFPGLVELAKHRITAKMRAKPPSWEDLNHLLGHQVQGRDYFLTWDRGILLIADELKGKHGISVMAPDEYVAIHGDDLRS